MSNNKKGYFNFERAKRMLADTLKSDNSNSNNNNESYRNLVNEKGNIEAKSTKHIHYKTKSNIFNKNPFYSDRNQFNHNYNGNNTKGINNNISRNFDVNSNNIDYKNLRLMTIDNYCDNYSELSVNDLKMIMINDENEIENEFNDYNEKQKAKKDNFTTQMVERELFYLNTNETLETNTNTNSSKNKKQEIKIIEDDCKIQYTGETLNYNQHKFNPNSDSNLSSNKQNQDRSKRNENKNNYSNNMVVVNSLNFNEYNCPNCIIYSNKLKKMINGHNKYMTEIEDLKNELLLLTDSNKFLIEELNRIKNEKIINNATNIFSHIDPFIEIEEIKMKNNKLESENASLKRRINDFENLLNYYENSIISSIEELNNSKML